MHFKISRTVASTMIFACHEDNNVGNLNRRNGEVIPMNFVAY